MVILYTAEGRATRCSDIDVPLYRINVVIDARLVIEPLIGYNPDGYLKIDANLTGLTICAFCRSSRRSGAEGYKPKRENWKSAAHVSVVLLGLCFDS